MSFLCFNNCLKPIIIFILFSLITVCNADIINVSFYRWRKWAQSWLIFWFSWTLATLFFSCVRFKLEYCLTSAAYRVYAVTTTKSEDFIFFILYCLKATDTKRNKYTIYVPLFKSLPLPSVREGRNFLLIF